MNNEFYPPYKLNTAVLFLVFNRLDVTKQVFDVIKKAKPPRLYIASDGARNSVDGENEKVQEIRDFVISSIDWDCEVKTLFRDKNMGCGPSVKNAIDWFFKSEEMGIILEDDCLPDQSFFRFCEELLLKYELDDRIGMISGNNHAGYKHSEESYLFSKFKACWGWATWRTAWVNMDFEMQWLNTESKNSIINNMGYGRVSVKHWSNSIKLIKNNEVSAWDWQWFFSLAVQNQLCIFLNSLI